MTQLQLKALKTAIDLIGDGPYMLLGISQTAAITNDDIRKQVEHISHQIIDAKRWIESVIEDDKDDSR